jgi:hypothetical protein
MTALAALSQAAAGSFAAAIWQGILLALAAALALRLLPKVPASARFAIWFAVFLAVAALPLAWLLPHRAGISSAAHPLLILDSRWCLAILALWAIASLFRATTLLVAALRLRSLWRRATPLDLDAAHNVLSEINSPSDPDRNCHPERSEGPAVSRPLAPERAAQLCVSDLIDRPSIIGFFAPKILIPRWLLAKLTPAELHQIVLHEGTHLRRADDWLNLLQKLALVLFPLNPALLWVERRLCLERELACDEQVLRATGAPRAYAACLASLAQHHLAHRIEHRIARRSLALALGALGRAAGPESAPRSELGRRIHTILTSRVRMSAAHARLVTGLAALALVAAAVELSRSPQFIAFAPASTQTAALATPAHFAPTPMGPYAAQNVVFHPSPIARMTLTSVRGSEKSAKAKPIYNSSLPTSENLPHESLLKAPQPARPVHGWLVVTTSWVASDGSRLVLTTARTSDAYPVAGDPDAADAGQPAQPTAQPQVHLYALPYAAVPVRDGWLIFQL